MKPYTTADLTAQLARARAMTSVRLTRTCEEDCRLGRMIENRDVFSFVPPHLHVACQNVVSTIRADWEHYIGNPDRRC